MKKTWMLLVISAVLCLCFCVAGAENISSPGAFRYVVMSNGSVAIDQYVGTGASVTVPETIEGYPVKQLSGHAFSNRSDVTVVYLPDSIETIPRGCFSACPAQLYTGIDGQTAQALSKSGYSFSAAGYPSINLIYTFAEDGRVKDLEASARSTSIVSVDIPWKVTAIAPGGFQNCAALTRVYLPAGVSAIGKNAFEGCVSLTDVSLPESLLSIGDQAFRGCVSLRQLDIPDGLSSVGKASGNQLFENCPAELYANLMTQASVVLSRAGVPFIVPAYPNAALMYTFSADGSQTGLSARRRNDAITSVIIPPGVTEIASGGFYGCAALTSVVIPEGVTVIRSNAFQGCATLKSVVLPSTLTSIESWAFRGCFSLPEITLPNGLSSITPGGGSWPFSDCPALLYASLNSAAATAISKAEQYFEVTGYPSVALQYTFDGSGNKSGLTARRQSASITVAAIPNGATMIVKDGFADCASLEQVVIPDSVVSIGANAFPLNTETLSVGCASYALQWAKEQNIRRDTDASRPAYCYHVIHSGYIIPNPSVSPTETTLGATGGTHCSICGDSLSPARIIPALKDMNTFRVPFGVEVIEEEAFIDMICQAVIIPSGCREIGARAFADCPNLIYVSIPASVVYIAPDAFENCGEGLIRDRTRQ